MGGKNRSRGKLVKKMSGATPDENQVQENIRLLAQECIAAAPVIVLGSGASAAHNIPSMEALRKELISPKGQPGFAGNDEIIWFQVTEALEKTDLESALSNITLTDPILRHIICKTWEYITPHDLAVLDSIIKDNNHLPLTRLFHHLFKSTHRKIDVVTTNYDRLAEYAVDAGDLLHFTGFGFGYLRQRSPALYPFFQGRVAPRRVNIWKVHGSLDWFRGTRGTIALPLKAAPYDDYTPDIVTPGIEKYRQTHTEPFRTIIAESDQAIQAAQGYLCVGYGFNDEHIQPKLIERSRTGRVPLVVITKEITPKLRTLLQSGQIPRYLVLEENNQGGSKAYTAEHPQGLVLPGEPIWQLNSFLNIIM